MIPGKFDLSVGAMMAVAGFITLKLGEPARQDGRLTADAQTVAAAGPSAACADHRQASLLPRCEARDHAWESSIGRTRVSQPRGECPSGDPTAGRDHEAFQVTRAPAALRLDPRSDRQHLPSTSPRNDFRGCRTAAMQVWWETAQIKAAQVWRACALHASPRLLFGAQGDRKAKDRRPSHPGF